MESLIGGTATEEAQRLLEMFNGLQSQILTFAESDLGMTGHWHLEPIRGCHSLAEQAKAVDPERTSRVVCVHENEA